MRQPKHPPRTDGRQYLRDGTAATRGATSPQPLCLTRTISRMGCCGGSGDDEDDLLAPLASPSDPNSDPDPNPNPFSSSAEVLSPMNSHFSALSSSDLLRSILQRLPPDDLSRAACVCRLWRAVATDRSVLEAVFRAPWGVSRVVGEPASLAFWRSASLSRFAISHPVRLSDTVPGLALKYAVQVTDIKRFNNMMSDHGIYSRERLLIPISKPEILLGSTCYIELDENAKREVAVIYPEGCPSRKVDMLTNNAATSRRRRKILESVRQSLRVDDGTAEYYLSIANGDPKSAMMEYSEDLSWEQQRTDH